MLSITVYNALEIAYMCYLLPIKFLTNSPYVFFDPMLPFVLACYCLFATFVVSWGYFIKKRALEMQFNARMAGKWVPVTRPPIGTIEAS